MDQLKLQIDPVAVTMGRAEPSDQKEAHSRFLKNIVCLHSTNKAYKEPNDDEPIKSNHQRGTTQVTSEVTGKASRHDVSQFDPGPQL